jgi:hypothetical protein
MKAIGQICQEWRLMEEKTPGSAIGSKYILTGGPEDQTRASGQFLVRGYSVSIAGDHGDREVKLVAINTKAPSRMKKYKKSKAKKPDYLWEKRTHLLKPDGEPVYVEGNQTTLVRSVLRAGLKDRYSMFEARGWLIQLRSEPRITPDDLSKRNYSVFVKVTDKDEALRIKAGKVRTGNLEKNYDSFTGILVLDNKGIIHKLRVPKLEDLVRKYAFMESLWGKEGLTSTQLFEELRKA